MSSCFQSFSYASNINCCISKDTHQSKGKKNHTYVKLPILRQEEGIRSPADRNYSTPLTGCVGIIGGLSVDSTLKFTEKLVNLEPEDEERKLPFILCSDPALGKELLSSEHIDRSLIVENIRHKRAFLEKSGVCCIVMPCHVLHSWYDEIREGCSVPFLHMGECVAKELKEAKLRPLEAGSQLRIGILATNENSVAKFYREKLENEGFEVLLPDKATMERIMIPAFEALSRKDTEGAQNLFRIALQVLLVRAVNRVILASDESRKLLPPDDPLWSKCIDPMDALARSAVKYTH